VAASGFRGGRRHVHQRHADLVDERFEPLGGGGPLRLLGGELIGRLADLLDGAVDLVGG
jgi:hypothetical protein